MEQKQFGEFAFWQLLSSVSLEIRFKVLFFKPLLTFKKPTL